MSLKGTKIGIGIIGMSLLATVIIASVRHNPATVSNALTIHPVTEAELAAPATDQTGQAHTTTVKKGDTLASIFDHLHLSAATLEEVTASSEAATHLASIRPGQKITFNISPHHELQQIIYPYNNESTLYVSSSAHGYHSEIKSKPVTIALSYKAGVVHHSFKAAALRAGLSLDLYNRLITIFEGTVDFKHGIHKGDRFAILYQEYYIDGHKEHSGKIVMAQFINSGKTHYAFRYTYPKNHTGYYTLNGHGVEPLFLKRPVQHYKRISSFFTYHRMDPYLHIMRPHLGIDFAAKRGTPIHSIGNGRVIFCGRDHGYGNAIVIRYSRKYKTLYGHMEKFAKGMHVGELVQRGQIIGYIGSTGWSTGPHLHFEMYVNGVPRDPLKLSFPGGEPVPASYSKRYLTYAHKMLNRFNLYQSAGFAENGSTKLKE